MKSNNKEMMSKAVEGSEPTKKVKDLLTSEKPATKITSRGTVAIHVDRHDDGTFDYHVSGSNVDAVTAIGMLEYAKRSYLEKLFAKG